MALIINSKKVGGLIINNKKVGGMIVNLKKVWPTGPVRLPASCTNGQTFDLKEGYEGDFVVSNTLNRVGSETKFGANVDLRFPTSYNNKLYATTFSSLYEINENTSIASLIRINLSSPNFRGVSGIAGHGSNLYAVLEDSSRNHALYTLDLSNLTAVRVGSENNFGVSEDDPQGLASLNGKLYMLGRETNVLYELNTATGAASRVGSANRFGISLTVPNQSSIGSFNNVLYMTTAGRAYYSLNTTDGTAVKLGDATAPGVNPVITGITGHNGQLFVIEGRGDILYTLGSRIQRTPGRYICTGGKWVKVPVRQDVGPFVFTSSGSSRRTSPENANPPVPLIDELRVRTTNQHSLVLEQSQYPTGITRTRISKLIAVPPSGSEISFNLTFSGTIGSGRNARDTFRFTGNISTDLAVLNTYKWNIETTTSGTYVFMG